MKGFNSQLKFKNFWLKRTFVSKTTRKNCSSDREKLLKVEDEGREFAKKFEITRTIYSNSERSEQFLATECFFNFCPWKFIISNKLEQLEFKLEKIIGIVKHTGKVRKRILFSCEDL